MTEASPRDPRSGMTITRCSSCSARIVWMKTVRGNGIPIDVDSLAMNEDEIADLPADTQFEFGVHVAHFMSCPHAAHHRRVKR
jgi:hypothetical protein